MDRRVEALLTVQRHSFGLDVEFLISSDHGKGEGREEERDRRGGRGRGREGKWRQEKGKDKIIERGWQGKRKGGTMEAREGTGQEKRKEDREETVRGEQDL
jgi:hypothetical protein